MTTGDGPARVLVVDDNESNREVLARRLSVKGYVVETAEDGERALALVEAAPPDLILLDVMMPGLSGFDVLDRLRKSHEAGDLPVIMATARDASEDVVRALTLGANDYVTKPLDFPIVLARVRTHLELKRARQELRETAERLREAQGRIAGLEASSSQALRDLPSWAASVASELAGAAGVREIGIFLVEEAGPRALVPTGVSPPSASALWAAASSRRPAAYEGGAVVAAVGMTGELLGGLAVPRLVEELQETQQRILASFAHQLAGSLELARVREQLAAERAKKEASRRQLIERGVDLVLACPVCGRCYDHRTERCEKDGELLEAPRTLPYRILDRYRLVRILGEGGMGTVFSARDERLNRDVAMKILKPEHFGAPAVRGRFEQEARALGQIDHPGVVTIYDTGELDEGSVFLVTELLRGRDLELLVRVHGAGRPDQVASLLRQAGAALAAAHRAGVLHRDIKPGNLFLVPHGSGFRVKMLDFGLAKSMRVSSGLTQSGLIVGTPAYMSPEQIQEKALDGRSDLYSLAVVAFEALTARRLVRATDLFEIFSEVVRGEPPRLSDYLAGVPARTDGAFASALARSPLDRPAAVDAWTEEVSALLERLPAASAGWPPESGSGELPRVAGPDENRTLPYHRP